MVIKFQENNVATDGGMSRMSRDVRENGSSDVTELIEEPLISLDELLDHREVVRVGLVRHHPPTTHELQAVLLNQPAQEQV